MASPKMDSRVFAELSTTLSAQDFLPKDMLETMDTEVIRGVDYLDILDCKTKPIEMELTELEQLNSSNGVGSALKKDLSWDEIINLIPTSSYVQIIDSKNTMIDKSDESSIYITEGELQRLWFQSSHRAFGRKIEDYDVKDALLLLSDDDTDEEMPLDNLPQTFPASDDIIPIIMDSNEPTELEVIDTDDEIVITSEVIQWRLHAVGAFPLILNL